MCRPREKLNRAKSSTTSEAVEVLDDESLRRRILKKIKRDPKYLWATERARIMKERSLGKWVGPLCLPMLLVIQPLTDYNLRSCIVLLVLSFLLWSQYKQRRSLKLRSWVKGLERHCEKCQQHLQTQLAHNSCNDLVTTSLCSPKVGWNVRSLRRLPWRLLSRHWGQLAHAQLHPWLALVAIWLYARLFSCKVEEAKRDKLGDYASLGDFFTRRLKPGARPVCATRDLVSPADGTVTWGGEFEGGFLQQVKGVHYSLNYFLGLQGEAAGNEGTRIHASCDDASQLLVNPDNVLHQWVVYLSPGDYHRFHSPADWTVHKRRHFPGELLSVKPAMTSSLPGLFHLNERVSWLGLWRHGFFSMTAVGATNVGSIHSDFEPDLHTNQAVSSKREYTQVTGCSRRSFYFAERVFKDPVECGKGQDFGHFSFGSTIVLLFEAPRGFELCPRNGDRRVMVGQGL